MNLASSTPDPADAAIARVLDAEAAAGGRVREAERDAASIVEAARREALAIAARAERRAREAQLRCEAKIAARIEALDAEANLQETRHALTADEAAVLERVVADVVAGLTGGA